MRENEKIIDVDYRLLTMKDVSEVTRCGVSTIYRLISQGQFPAPIKIGYGRGGNRWRSDEMEKWLEKKFEDSRLAA